MGLDTSHDCWHGACGAFTRWRDALAKAAGYAFVRPEGQRRDMVLIDWGHITEANLFGQWEETPADPLLVLIAHSDCEGRIVPRDAGPLADRIEQLLDGLPTDRDFGHVGDWRETTRRFVDGLRRAVAAGEDVEFH